MGPRLPAEVEVQVFDVATFQPIDAGSKRAGVGDWLQYRPVDG